MRIFDLHNDILSVCGKRKIDRYINRENYKGLSGLNCAVFTTGKSEKEIFDMARTFAKLKETQESFGSALDLCLSFEDLGFVTYKNLDRVILSAPKMCSLTWNYDNCYAGGVDGQAGLSTDGEKLVDILETCGILVDTAHLNEKSFVDVARIAKRPIICSHTAMHHVCNHNRNLKDYQIRIILESGGIVGLCFVGQFVSPSKRATVEDVAKHILHFVNTFGGVDGLAVGSDFFGTKNLPIGLVGYKDFVCLENCLQNFGFCKTDIDNLFFNNAAKLVHGI